MPGSATPSDGRVGGGLHAEKLAQEALAREMLASLPAGHEGVELDYSEVGPVIQASMWATKPGAPEISFPDIDEVVDAAKELRSAMYREDAGTWFSMKITVTAKRSVDVEFNYDELPWSSFDYAPNAYAADQVRFPRDDAHIPDWLRDRLNADRSDLELH